MIDRADLDRKLRRLSRLVATKFGIQGRDLDAQLRRLGRRMPRRERAEALHLLRAAQMVGNPRLEAQLDPARIEASYARLRKWLDAQDPADRRRGWLLGMLGGLVINLLLAFGLLLLVLYLRGFL